VPCVRNSSMSRGAVGGNNHGRVDCLKMASSLMPLDRDTRRSPRTRVLEVITRRSAHCSLLRTHKPGSQLLLCSARTLMPLRRFLNPSFDCSLLRSYPPFPKSTDPYSIPRSQIPGPRNVLSDNTLFHVSSSSRHAPARTEVQPKGYNT
jgi:hypothetical protein